MGGYQQLKDIEVYVLARKLADHVWKEVVGWDHCAGRTVGEQLIRAVQPSTTQPANNLTT